MHKGKVVAEKGEYKNFFLKFMSENGWKVFGIELSPEASKYAHSLGLNVLILPLKNFLRRSGTTVTLMQLI